MQERDKLSPEMYIHDFHPRSFLRIGQESDRESFSVVGQK